MRWSSRVRPRPCRQHSRQALQPQSRTRAVLLLLPAHAPSACRLNASSTLDALPCDAFSVYRAMGGMVSISPSLAGSSRSSTRCGIGGFGLCRLRCFRFRDILRFHHSISSGA